MPREGSFSAATGPDIVIPSSDGSLPIAIEVLVLRRTGISLSVLRDKSRRLRRQFPRGVHLVLVAVTDRFQTGSDGDQILIQLATLAVQPPSAPNSDAGFDQILVNYGQPNGAWADVGPPQVDLPPAEDGFTRVVKLISNSAQAERGVQPDACPTFPSPAPLRVLLVADEWHSGLGGISTVNRELATALARVGADVKVVVPEASRSDIAAAAEVGVELAFPGTIPGLSGKELLRGRPGFEDPIWEPQLIIGHGRILGPYAYAVQDAYYPNARRLHVVHTQPERLEQAKSGLETPPDLRDVAERRKVETELARTADLVAGVGPLLKAFIATEGRGWRGTGSSPQIFELIPGLKEWGELAVPSDLTESAQVLLIARADDIRSKGIDIAILATKEAAGGVPDSIERPELIIRGVPNAETADRLHQMISNLVGGSSHVSLRLFSADDADIRSDLMSCCMLLMPSRHEGFGLVALEAISAAVPVLISNESGLARLLQREFPDGHRPWPREVVETTENTEKNVAAWSRAILNVLLDPQGASERAYALRDQMASKFNWQSAARRIVDLAQPLGPRHL
jgi:D-inositol-3-phosphate glycosyltransferase